MAFPLVRQIYERIMYGHSDPLTLVLSDTPVKIQEQLVGAVNYVAEFSVDNIDLGAPTQGETVVIDHIRINDITDDGYEVKRQFYGTVDTIDAESYPNSVGVSCRGPLSKLRRKPAADHILTGKTDGQVVKYVLDFCGVTYDPADILQWGYTVGAVRDVFWSKDQSGSDLVQEIDRVFGFATIEVGNNRVVRFPFSYAPEDYASDEYGDSSVQKVYKRRASGSTYFAGGRQLGSVDSIVNYWRVEGLSWQGLTGAADEGCSYQAFASSYKDNALLGVSVYNAQSFTSDFIQSEALAKAIAIRQMRWYNRVTDTMRIECANDAYVNVGDLVAVKDQAFGMNLDHNTKYLVTQIDREGDNMTIELAGGVAGEYDNVHSEILKCCGSQSIQEGTCVDTGANPGADTNPNPSTPPDIIPDHCDPLTDTTCIPGVSYDLGAVPDFIHPIINCTEAGAFSDTCPDSDPSCTKSHPALLTCSIGSESEAICHAGAPWWQQSTYLVSDDLTYLCLCRVQKNWRIVSGLPWFKIDHDGIVRAIANSASTGSVVMRMSSELDDPLQTLATDVHLGTPTYLNLDFDVTFGKAGSRVRVEVIPFYGGAEHVGQEMSFEIYSTPGFNVHPTGSVVTYNFGIKAHLELDGPVMTGDEPVNHSHGALSQNNGGNNGVNVPLESKCHVNVFFDAAFGVGWGRITFDTSVFTGKMEHLGFGNEDHHLPGEPIASSVVCASAHDYHLLQITMIKGALSTIDDPAVMIEGLVVGYDTCEPNPDYVAGDTVDVADKG